MKSNKASADVVLLVFMAVVLSGWALFTFISNSNYMSGEVKDVRFLDEIYSDQDFVESYIDLIMSETLNEINASGDIKSQFIKMFNENFQKYSNLEVFLKFNLDSFVADESNTWIQGNEVYLRINFRLEGNFDKKIKLNYLSKKVFSRSFDS